MPVHNVELIIADSSFYICFLEDIQKPTHLLKMLNKFSFLIGPIVLNEVSKCTNYGYIKEAEGITRLASFNFGEILSPFFSKDQIKKGEAEVIALAYIQYESGMIHKFILDDGAARKIVCKNFRNLSKIMTGTIGFIADCHCDFSIFSKAVALTLLNEIKCSTFFVEYRVLSSVMGRIEGC